MPASTQEPFERIDVQRAKQLTRVDVRLLEESRAALDELTSILSLPGLYAFQKAALAT